MAAEDEPRPERRVRKPVSVGVATNEPSPYRPELEPSDAGADTGDGRELLERDTRRRWAERQNRLFPLRSYRPEERVYELQLCRWDVERPLPECDELADLLIESAAPELAEQRKLRALDEKWKRVRPAKPKPPPEPKVYACADGALSGCPCPGPRRGCCSWHGGIVGCE